MVLYLHEFMNLLSHYLHGRGKKNTPNEEIICTSPSLLADNENEAGFHPDPANPVQEFRKIPMPVS